MKFYSSIKKNEVINLSGKVMEPEKIILNEVAKTQRDKHLMFFLIRDS